MWDSLGYLGMVAILGYLVRFLAKAATDSGLEEVTVLKFRFKRNEKPQQQLKD